MSFTREYLEQHLDPSIPPIYLRGDQGDIPPLFIRHRLPARYGEQYKQIRQWARSKGHDPNGIVPDLSSVLQGVECLFIAASGKRPQDVNPNDIGSFLRYVNKPEDFEGGSLKQYPELWTMIRDALLTFPKGQEIVRIITESPENAHLLKK